MSIEGQGHCFTIYFPGFVFFVLYKATKSGERLQDHWSSGLFMLLVIGVCFHAPFTIRASGQYFGKGSLVQTFALRKHAHAIYSNISRL